MGNSVQQTSDGGFIITGETLSYGAGYDDIWLIKTDSMGNKEWDRTFGRSGRDYADSVQQTNDGGYVIAGETRSHGADYIDVWLIKTDSRGNKEWDRTFGGSESDWGNSAKQTYDGVFIITGGTESYGAGESDVWLIKTGSMGNTAWDRTFGGSDSDWGNSVEQTSNGGSSSQAGLISCGAGESDVWLIKTDFEGKCVQAMEME